MARRQRSAADLGPAVPRWCVEFDSARWTGGVAEWQSAVSRWSKANLYKSQEFSVWVDVISNSYRVASALRAWA